MNNIYSIIYKSFIFASVLCFLIGFFTETKTSLDANISGYALLTFSILMILVLTFSNILKTTSNDTFYNTIIAILTISGPLILILGIIVFILYLIIYYREKIINGHVAPGYNSFSNIIIILLLIQIYIVYTNINTEKFEITGKISKITTNIIYLLGLLVGISTTILYTILKYYSTDGFATLHYTDRKEK